MASRKKQTINKRGQIIRTHNISSQITEDGAIVVEAKLSVVQKRNMSSFAVGTIFGKRKKLIIDCFDKADIIDLQPLTRKIAGDILNSRLDSSDKFGFDEIL